MQFKFVFCSKGTKASQTVKITVMFRVIPFNNADSFFTAR